jgi:hypothetical protein
VVGRQVPLIEAIGPCAFVVPWCPPIEVQCNRKTTGICRPFYSARWLIGFCRKGAWHKKAGLHKNSLE